MAMETSTTGTWDACLQRLFDYRIRLRREKCKFRQQAIMWFRNIFSKQGMSPDPEKVEHIKAWKAPASKEEVKSFLQTVNHKSRSLVKSERNYKKVEGESLAIYSGCIMNRRYLFGKPFTVKTDHSALLVLYNNTGRPAPHRVDRHRGRLGAFRHDGGICAGKQKSMRLRITPPGTNNKGRSWALKQRRKTKKYGS